VQVLTNFEGSVVHMTQPVQSHQPQLQRESKRSQKRSQQQQQRQQQRQPQQQQQQQQPQQQPQQQQQPSPPQQLQQQKQQQEQEQQLDLQNMLLLQQKQSWDQAGRSDSAPDSQASEKPRKNCLHRQFHKTKMCNYHLKGTCHFGEDCAFAHSSTELQATPDLRNTRMCKAHQEGGCNDPECSFAHGEEELVSTGLFHKKSLCKCHEKGKCRNGDQCRFAHGFDEIRGFSPASCPPPPGTSDNEEFRSEELKQLFSKLGELNQAPDLRKVQQPFRPAANKASANEAEKNLTLQNAANSVFVEPMKVKVGGVGEFQDIKLTPPWQPERADLMDPLAYLLNQTPGMQSPLAASMLGLNSQRGLDQLNQLVALQTVSQLLEAQSPFPVASSVSTATENLLRLELARLNRNMTALQACRQLNEQFAAVNEKLALQRQQQDLFAGLQAQRQVQEGSSGTRNNHLLQEAIRWQERLGLQSAGQSFHTLSVSQDAAPGLRS